MRSVLIAVLFSLIAGILFAFIYPAVRGATANSSNDGSGRILARC